MDLTAVCVGECLMDLIPDSEDSSLFRARPGGAPINLAAALARLGNQVSVLTVVGSDAMGRQLLDAIARSAVGTSLVQVSPRASGLAIVDKSAPGGFRLFRSPEHEAEVLAAGLHELLAIPDIDLLHLSPLLLCTDAGLEVADALLAWATRCGIAISVDLNLRPTAWPDTQLALARTSWLADQAHFVKCTRQEHEQVAPFLSLGPGTSGSWLITDGPSQVGAFATKGVRASMLVPSVKVVDETGAGDAAFAAFLNTLVARHPLAVDITEAALREAVSSSVAYGCEAVQSAGGSLSWPSSHS